VEFASLPFILCRWRLGALQCAHTHAQRQECGSLTLLLFSQRAPSSWRGCGCAWAPRHMLGWRMHPFPWHLLLVHSAQRSSARGYAHMHSLHCCEARSALGGCCISLLLGLLITSLHHAAFFLLFFLLLSFFFVDCCLSHFTLTFFFVFSCLIHSFTSVSFSLSRPCPLQPAPLNTGEAAQPLISVGVFLPTVYKK